MAADIFDTDEDKPVSRASALAAFASRQWTARGVPWIGAVLIGVIVVTGRDRHCSQPSDCCRGNRP